MKHRLSISVDEETILGLFEKLRTGQFRNKSHIVECAIKQFLEEQDG